MSEASLTPASPGLRTGRARVILRWAAVAAALALVAVGIAIVYWRPIFAAPANSFAEGRSAISRQEWAAARQFMRQLRSSPAHQAQAAFLRGEMLFCKGHYYPALDELARVNELASQPAQDAQDAAQLKLPRLVLVGQCWYHLGRHLEAQQVLLEVLRRDPNSVDAHRWLAASYYDLGAIHDALVHLRKTAELDPADQRPHRLLGLIYKDYERYDDAVPSYEESLRRKPDQADAQNVRLELATCQLRLRRHRDALKTLEESTESPEVDVVRAECHYAIGETDEARKLLARALAAAPENLDVLLLRGTMLLDDGNSERAVEIFNRGAALHPHDYMVHFKLAQALAQAGKPKQAEAEQARAEEIRKIRLEFAQLHQVAWNQPQDVAIRLRLAELANLLGRPDLADVWLKSAAALAPLAIQPKGGSGATGGPQNNATPGAQLPPGR